MFQFWFLEKCLPAGRLVQRLLLVLGEAVPGEGVVDRGDHSTVGVDCWAGTASLLHLTSAVRTQNTT